MLLRVCVAFIKVYLSEKSFFSLYIWLMDVKGKDDNVENHRSTNPSIFSNLLWCQASPKAHTIILWFMLLFITKMKTFIYKGMTEIERERERGRETATSDEQRAERDKGIHEQRKKEMTEKR